MPVASPYLDPNDPNVQELLRMQQLAQAQQGIAGFPGGGLAEPPIQGQVDPLYIGPSPEEVKRQDDMRQKLTGLMEREGTRQQGNIQQMRQRADEMRQASPGVDWTMAASFIDLLNQSAGTPSHLGAMYAQSGMRPMTEPQRIERIRDAEKDIVIAEQKLLDSQIDALKIQAQPRAGAYETGRTIAARAAQDRFNAQQAINRQKEFATFRNKQTAQMADEKKAFDVMEHAFNSGNFQMVMSSLGSYARQVAGEKGVLTDQDITRVIPRSVLQDAAKLESYFSTTGAADVAVTPEWTKALRKMIDLTRKKVGDKYRTEISTFKENTDLLPMYGSTKAAFKPLYDKTDKLVDEAFGPAVQKTEPSAEEKLKRLKELEAKAAQ